MKFRLLIFSLMFTFTAFAGMDVFDDIIAQLKAGNAHELAKYFDTSIELKTSDKSNVVSRKQAEMIVKDFFEKNKVKKFTLMHKGSSSKGALYAIGTLETDKGNYRTNLYLKENNGRLSIQELTFELE